MSLGDTRCEACGSPLLAVDARCPACGVAVAGALTREGEGDRLSRALEAGLAREAESQRMARGAPLDALVRQADIEMSLSPADLLQSRASEEALGTVRDLEQALPAGLAKAELGELRLARLIDKHTDLHVIRTGLVLLRKKRYAEACEWWSLQHARFEQDNPRFALLLLVLELLSRKLSGQREEATAARQRVLAHPLFARLTTSEGGRR